MVPLKADSIISDRILSSDEWVARGLDFAWEVHNEAPFGYLPPVTERDLMWIDRAIQCFEKAGAAGVGYASRARVHKGGCGECCSRSWRRERMSQSHKMTQCWGKPCWILRLRGRLPMWWPSV